MNTPSDKEKIKKIKEIFSSGMSEGIFQIIESSATPSTGTNDIARIRIRLEAAEKEIGRVVDSLSNLNHALRQEGFSDSQVSILSQALEECITSHIRETVSEKFFLL